MYSQEYRNRPEFKEIGLFRAGIISAARIDYRQYKTNREDSVRADCIFIIDIGFSVGFAVVSGICWGLGQRRH